MITITFPDGNSRQYEKNITGLEIAKSISHGLAKKSLVVLLNDTPYELNREIKTDATITFVTWDDQEGKQTYWHSSAHLLAEALQELYPKVKFGIGPPIKYGFYYDVDLGGETIKEEDFPTIEKTMQRLAKNANRFERKEISKQDAIEYFEKKGDEYKLELLENLKDGDITFYSQGSFTDLCKGAHIPHTGLIKNVKILNTAGAYWRGDESRKQLTRIYGITFPKKEELDTYLEKVERAKQSDHRKIGKQLSLFMFSEMVGAGLPIWLPNGTFVRQKLMEFIQNEQVKAGYKLVTTPHIGGKKLYETSGHYEKYGSDSFQPIKTPVENEEFLLKPMNCPHHCMVYDFTLRSYRDLPYRLAEFGTVYRYEQSGELHGMTRVRGFTQDDAHIFCTPEQVQEEFCNVIDLIMKVFKSLSFETFKVQVSLRDKNNKEKYIGDDKNWEKAEKDILDSVKSRGLSYTVAYGEAAFYGPKLDFMVEDSLEREWQLGTIQVDYNLPERFNLSYVNSQNQKERPVMIHRAPLGSLERFLAILIEHCGGHLPLWLAPVQVAILPISDVFNNYAEKIDELLKNSDIRTFFDTRNEKINRKIKDAEMSKIPYKIIVGQKEVENNVISVRKDNKTTYGVNPNDFLKELTETNLLLTS